MCSTRKMMAVFLLVSLASVAAAQSPEDYFPLQVGNTWTYLREWRYMDGFDPAFYVESVDRVTITTTATEEFEGRAYWAFEATIHQPYSVDPNTLDLASEGFWSAEQITKYRRSEEGNVWRLHKPNGTFRDQLLYDLSLLEEERYSYAGGGSPTYVWRIKESGYEVPAGVFDGYSFSFGFPTEWHTGAVLSAFVGAIRLSGSDDVGQYDCLYLLHAVVNGREYGESAVRASSWGHIKSLF